jgi:TRAP-type mannitol/chloroaromatic compound transport system substrate-binding protein
MSRRDFLKKASVGSVGVASAFVGQAAFAEGPKISWTLASSFPKSLDTIYGAAEIFAMRVDEATNGNFKIAVKAANEVLPPMAVMDGVKEGTVQCGHTCSYYYVGKDPAFAFDTAIPFGMNSRQQSAWLIDGGGLNVLRELFKRHNILNLPCGNTGTQMGGWFNKEIKTPDDLKGLNFRVGGFAGQVLQKLGVLPKQMPGGDIYMALEKGTIDAAEWVGPYDDEKLGLNKVTKFYYYPGWWEGGAQLSLYINEKAFASLPREYKAIVVAAATEAHAVTQARYDARNPQALKRLIAGGTQLKPFPEPVIEACYQAAMQLYSEISKTNPMFGKLWAHYKGFLDDQLGWSGVSDTKYDVMMQNIRKRNTK